MTARQVVFISLERWDEVWRRNQHLLTRLRAKGIIGDVLYVEPSVDPLHALLRRHRPRIGRGLRPLGGQAGVTVLEGTKLLPRRLDRRQDDRWADSVRTTAQRIGLDSPLLWVNDPRGAVLLDRVAWPAVYDITDDWLLATRPEAELNRLRSWESSLLERCAEVVVCSPALQRSKSRARPVTLIPNAVDIDLFRSAQPRPADLPSGPLALYVGTLHSDRLDVGLCCTTAESLRARGVRLVLVGPDALDDAERARLDASGVIRLGARPSHAVPAYLQHADVLVVPHLVTPFTESLDPIKAYEYAASGRPTVSTPVAGFRELPDCVIAAASAFPAALERVLASRVSSTRESTPIPTWEQRAEQFSRVLNTVPEKP
ncbi:MAG TPA: glycosyltransferase [Flexivirga sp.]|uniref:glycosyltransferase n=1 Tax=Flexivirga sp. TaxID=1962927 RepID=UPI002BB55690|nr:glycosyltransferase [Flexivirga sp.]HWC23442.1 glycosyltransferase [Flexivirga sp.]